MFLMIHYFTIHLHDKDDISVLKKQSYINKFTKHIKIESIFYSPSLQTYIVVRINFNFFPEQILRKFVIYVSIVTSLLKNYFSNLNL